MKNYIKITHVGEENLRDAEALPLVTNIGRRRQKTVNADASQQDPRHFDSWVYFFDDQDKAGCIVAFDLADRKRDELSARLPREWSTAKRFAAVRMSIYSKVPWLDLPVVGVSPRADRIEEPAAAQ